eukprot:1161744-Pelagomonas_calceolata.AAC.16
MVADVKGDISATGRSALFKSTAQLACRQNFRATWYSAEHCAPCLSLLSFPMQSTSRIQMAMTSRPTCPWESVMGA